MLLILGRYRGRAVALVVAVAVAAMVLLRVLDCSTSAQREGERGRE